MEILEAFDLMRCAHSVAALVGVDAKSVAHHVAMRDAGQSPFERPGQPKLIVGTCASPGTRAAPSRLGRPR
jgi:hypothetical protein